MPFVGILWSIVSWALREVVLKFLIMGAVFVVVAELTPLALGYLGNFISPAGLNSAFSGVPAGVWFFLDFFALDVGLPLVISAYISRFLIRRIPIIG